MYSTQWNTQITSCNTCTPKAGDHSQLARADLIIITFITKGTQQLPTICEHATEKKKFNSKERQY